MSFKNIPPNRLVAHAKCAVRQAEESDLYEFLPDPSETEPDPAVSLLDALRDAPVSNILAAVMIYEALPPKELRRIETDECVAMVVGVTTRCRRRLSPRICSGREKRMYEYALAMARTVSAVGGQGQLSILCGTT
ncbi:hypothetical protein [Methylorubrum extorquens]|uniref:hypothetical protein n=1 Tax=Methylorubrum extorquens TaxID=408 RepID=UPI000158EDCC|nr:hypothetical protein [Methylorubrum extorquens]ABY28893.1 hypothetical protein Mext_0472 [Methylorubrum extorquens PA1]WIU40255.1 hypothetical protein KQ926_02485 [Methylorubrum extorquens]